MAYSFTICISILETSDWYVYFRIQLKYTPQNIIVIFMFESFVDSKKNRYRCILSLCKAEVTFYNNPYYEHLYFYYLIDQ